MIRGDFNGTRPLISGLLFFPKVSRIYVRANFLVDSGADVSLVSADAYETVGLNYELFASFPDAKSSGYGGRIEAKCVPAKLFLEDNDTGAIRQIGLEVEVLKPLPPTDPADDELPPTLPSIIGRDVTDLFRLTIDRSVGLVALGDPEGKP